MQKNSWMKSLKVLLTAVILMSCAASTQSYSNEKERLVCPDSIPLGKEISINNKPHVALNEQEYKEALLLLSCSMKLEMLYANSLKDNLFLKDDANQLETQVRLHKIKVEELIENRNFQKSLRVEEKRLFDKKLKYERKKKREGIVIGVLSGTLVGAIIGGVTIAVATK